MDLCCQRSELHQSRIGTQISFIIAIVRRLVLTSNSLYAGTVLLRSWVLYLLGSLHFASTLALLKYQAINMQGIGFSVTRALWLIAYLINI